MMTLALLAGSLILLMISSDKFVMATEEIGLSLGVPGFVMGISVLAVGTSLPELLTGIISVNQGSSELVVGTVIGSNIANILLILGISAIFSKNFTILWDLMHGDLPILFGSLLLMGFIIYPLSTVDLQVFREISHQIETTGQGNPGMRSVVNFSEGLILLAGYLLYLHYYVLRNREELQKVDKDEERPDFKPMSVVWIILGGIGVYFGAQYTVDAAIELARLMGMGTEVIAASIIAAGTSVPELVVALSAVRRNNFEMAMGNVTGSNIFNTFVVLSVPSLAAPFIGDGQPIKVGMDSVLFLQFPYYCATMFIFLVIVLDKTLTRTEGFVILLAYALFFSKLFGLL